MLNSIAIIVLAMAFTLKTIIDEREFKAIEKLIDCVIEQYESTKKTCNMIISENQLRAAEKKAVIVPEIKHLKLTSKRTNR